MLLLIEIIFGGIIILFVIGLAIKATQLVLPLLIAGAALWLIYTYTQFFLWIIVALIILTIIGFIIQKSEQQGVISECLPLLDSGDIETTAQLFVKYSQDKKKIFISEFSKKTISNKISEDCFFEVFLLRDFFCKFSGEYNNESKKLFIDKNIADEYLTSIWGEGFSEFNSSMVVNHIKNSSNPIDINIFSGEFKGYLLSNPTKIMPNAREEQITQQSGGKITLLIIEAAQNNINYADAICLD